jgi:hypothetical protein
MPAYDIIPATMELAERMAPNMRAEDVAEVHAIGQRPLEALQVSISMSDGEPALCWTVDGEPAMMWGIQSLDGRLLGIPWLLGTPLIRANKYEFLELCYSELGRFLYSWGRLINWVDVRYEVSLKWAARLGFRVHPPSEFGPLNMLFCKIEIER